jgi:hypothetical protein
MKRSKPTKVIDLTKKRAFIVPEEPVDIDVEEPPTPTEEGSVNEVPDLVEVDPDLSNALNSLADFIEQGDLPGLHGTVDTIAGMIGKMKDARVQAVYQSLNKVWMTLGYLKNQIQDLKEGTDAYKLDKAFGQSNRLYAWMKHVEKIEPRLALPEGGSFTSSNRGFVHFKDQRSSSKGPGN